MKNQKMRLCKLLSVNNFCKKFLESFTLAVTVGQISSRSKQAGSQRAWQQIFRISMRKIFMAFQNRIKSPFTHNFTWGTGKAGKIVSKLCAIATLGISPVFAGTVGQSSNTNTTSVPSPTPYTVISRDANARVWERTTSELSKSGQVIVHKHHYTELATGLCYKQDGKWADSKEQISILPDGSAAATNGQHQANFPANIYNGLITLLTPDELQLRSRPLGLSYDDGTNTVLIAELTNSVGQLISSNQVIYTNAFIGVDADLLYTYRKSGLEQDVIFREQPPKPEECGLNSLCGRLQLLTEYFDPPSPLQTVAPPSAQDGLQDTKLTFGQIKMIQGKAFSIDRSSQRGSVNIPVYKSWTIVDGRTFLIEEVPYKRISPQLTKLPQPSTRVSQLKSHALRKLSSKGWLPPKRFVETTTNCMQLAKADFNNKSGVVLDYITVDTGQNNFTFQGDTTYYIDNIFSISGNVVFEGGTVLKYSDNADGTILAMNDDTPGALSFQSGSYRPVIFTSMDDDSVGEHIDGSNGEPVQNDWDTYILLEYFGTGRTNVINNVRMSYAGVGIEDDYANETTIYDSQFFNCYSPILGSGQVTLENDLFSYCSSIINEDGGDDAKLINVTADNCSVLMSDPNLTFSGSVELTNSLLSYVTYMIGIPGADGYPYNVPTTLQNTLIVGTNSNANIIYSNNYSQILGPTNIFQTVGGGCYYLTNGSPYRGFGTAKINPDLLAELGTKTTIPPTVFLNLVIHTNTVLGPLVSRDTNTTPDLGYHYDPIDYVFGGCDLYSNLTFTAGTAVGWYSAYGTAPTPWPYGISMSSGSTLSFSGNVTQPCVFANYTTVQEAFNGSWTNSFEPQYDAGITIGATNNVPVPLLFAFFTKVYVTASDTFLADNYNNQYDNGFSEFKNCEFYEGGVQLFASSISYTNCLFFRDYSLFQGQIDASSFTFQNCTFYEGYLDMQRYNGQQSSFWLVENSSFDGTAFTCEDNFNGRTNNTLFNYNAYNTNNLDWQTYPSLWTATNTLETNGPNDVLVTNFNWESSWLGDFYLPANSLLIQKGSTNASFLGLYHFTTKTNQIPEGTNKITIGYHYVATDQDGNPLDSNSNGIPDYLEDLNGNGIDDTNETPWDLAILSQPQSTNVAQGQNATFSATVGGIGPFTYQWQSNGVSIAGANSNSYTILVVPPSDDGQAYTLIVSNADIHVTSSNAILWVSTPVVLSGGPNDQTVTNGGAASFSITNSSGTHLGYQWFYYPGNTPIGNSARIGGVTSSNLTFSNVQVSDATNCYVVVSNAFNSMASGVAALTVITNPVISSISLYPGTNAIQSEDVTFSVIASGETYLQWWSSNSIAGSNNIANANQSSYTLLVAQTTNDGFFGVTVTNLAGSTNDRTVLNLLVPPWITQQPTNLVVNQGNNATFSISAFGTTNLCYQWFENETNAIPWATTNYITLTNAVGTNAAGYSCVITNIAGTSTSAWAWLSVNVGGVQTNGWGGTGTGSPPSSVPEVSMFSPTNSSPTNPAIHLYDGNPISIRATASSTYGYVTNVEFYFTGTNTGPASFTLAGNAVPGPDNQFALAWASALKGTNIVEAVAQDYDGQASTSSVVYLIMAVAPCFSPAPDTNLVWEEGIVSTNIQLTAIFTNDGQPYSFVTNINWSAPSGVALTSPHVFSTGAIFTNSGTFPLQLEVDNGYATNIQTTTVTIRRRPQVIINWPTNYAAYPIGTPVALKATATSIDSSVTNVTFYTNSIAFPNSAIQSINNSWTYLWSTTTNYTYSLTAIATDEYGVQGTSSNVTVTIYNPNPYVQITYPVNQVFNAYSNITVTALATNSPYAAPIGAVEFFAGTSPLGYANSTSNIYQIFWMPFDAGTYVLTAEAIATNGLEGWSLPVTNIVYGVPGITITTPLNNANLGSMLVNTQITASVTSAGAAITNVSFYTNNFLLGTNLQSPYEIPWQNIGNGIYMLTATATDTNGATGISPNFFVTVEPSNQPPFVYAGPTQATNLPFAQLTGYVSDDGLPSNYLSVTWSAISNPSGGIVTFGNSNLPMTTASFNTNGIYALQLVAFDGQLLSTSRVQITVYVTNLPPVISAPPVQTVVWPLPQNSSTNNILWPSIQSITFTDAPSIDSIFIDDVGYFLPNFAYNVASNCLMTTVGRDVGNGYVQTECLYFDNNLNLTCDLGSYGIGPFVDGSPPFASVQNTIGGFPIGDNFFGLDEGVIMRVKPDGETVGTNVYTDLNGVTQSNAWVVITPEVSASSGGGYFESLWVDQTGVWGGDLIGSCQDGSVWRVNSLGEVSLIVRLPSGIGEKTLMTIIPDNLRQYGPWAGRLLIDDRSGSGADDAFYAVDTNGFIIQYTLFTGTTLVSEPVPQDENLFACDVMGPSPNEFQTIPASQLDGMTGDMLMIDQVDTSLQRIHWNGTAFDIHQLGTIFASHVDLGTLNFVYCPLGVTNVPSTDFRLQACISDDGKLFDSTSNLWVEVSGPGSVTFADPTLTNTPAEFSTPGAYVLRLTAYDGQFTSYTNIQVNVVYNRGPLVNAGTNQIIPGTNVTLNCTIQDDGFPSNQLAIAWSVISAPLGGLANLNWTNQMINSTNDTLTNSANFSLPGTYVFQVTANDGQLTSSAEVTVTVETACLTLSPSFGWPTLTNTPFTVTATLVDSNSVPITNAAIQFTVSDLSQENTYTNWSTNTDSNGNAPFTYTGADQRGDLITVLVTNNSQLYQAKIIKDWALNIDCGSVVEGGNWTSASMSMPPFSAGLHSADYYIFHGNADSTATLSITNVMGGDYDKAVNFVIWDPSNSVVAVFDNESLMANSSYGQLTFPLVLAGDYVIEIISVSQIAFNGYGHGPPYGLALSCNGDTNAYLQYAPPQMQLLYNGTNYTSGQTIVFPPTVPSQTTNISLIISNSGAADLIFNEIDTNSQFGGLFLTSNALSSATIHPGSSTNLNVTFSPTTNGTILGQLAFYGNMANGGCYMAYLSGTAFSNGAPPSIVVTAPQNFSTYYSPAVIPLTAMVSPGITNVASVTFEELAADGATIVANANNIANNTWGATWMNVPNGNYTLTAVATDASGRTTAAQPVSINVLPIVLTNLPPVVTNASFSVQVNSVNNVLDSLAHAYDPNGDPLTIAQVKPPTFGTASIINNGSRISYTPKPGYCSQSIGGYLQPFDEFSYEVSDGKGGFTWAQITILVYPAVPPIIAITNPPASYSPTAGSSMLITASITNVPATNIAKVQFYMNGNPAGVGTNGSGGSYSLNWTNLYYGNDGVETFTAEAYDVLGEVSVLSPPLKITVHAPTGGQGLTASLDHITGSYPGSTSLASHISNGSVLLPTIRDGVFNLYGYVTNILPASVTWQLGVYSSDGSTLLRNLASSTSFVGTAGNPALVLSNCDLSTLINGVYDLRLTAEGGGQETNVDAQFILESNLKIGQFSFSQQDLVIPVNGIPLTVTRSYNSQDPHEGDFGYGWTYSLSDMDVQLDETRDQDTDKRGNTYNIRTGGGRDVTLTLPNGQRTTFYYAPTADGLGNITPHWKAGPGITATLESGPTSAPYEVSILSIEGGQPYWYDPADASDVPDESYDFPSFTLKTSDGTQYVLDRPDLDSHPTGGSGSGHTVHAYGTPYLYKIIQRNTNTITIATNAITFGSLNGTTNHIFIQRNSQGLISSISDPNSIASNGPPAVKYEYDSNGNLMYVERLVNSSTFSYTTNYFFYANPNFPHYITSLHDGDGTQVAENFYDDSGKLIKTVDANGNTTYFNNSFTNNTEVVVDALGRTNTFAYDSFGNVIALTNALGEITTMAYDQTNNKTNTVTYLLNGNPYATNNATYSSLNLILSSTDPLGHTNGFTYDNNGDLLSSSDARGNTTHNFYDTDGTLTNTTDAMSNSTVNAYNYGLLISSTDPIHTTTINNYDSGCNITNSAVLDASGAILSSNTYTYDANGNRHTSTVWRHVGLNWTNATTTYVYDAQNREIQMINPDGGASTIAYNLNGQQEETIDPLSHTNSYFYDPMGHLIKTQYSDGTTTLSAYDAAGNRTNNVDQLGRITIYQYDALNRLTNTIYPDNTTSTTVYDDLGRITESIDARGTITASGYDIAGRRIAVTNALGVAGITNINFYTYDPNDNQITFTDANGHTTTNIYDVLNRQIEMQHPDGTTNETVYDADGRSVAQVNQDDITNLFGYDGAGRLINVTNALKQVTRYQYDEAGNEMAQIDALLRTNLYFYDGQGRRIAHTMPGGQIEGFAYDLDGNQIYETNFNGAVITNQYDVNNRMINVSSVYGYNVRYVYSATGQRISMVDPSGTYAYTYDQRDRLLSKTNYWNNGPTNSLNYLYDPNGNVTNIYSSTPDGVNLQYAYDPLNRLTNVLANGTAAARYAYDLAGNLNRMQYGNGVTNQYQYDSLNRLTNLTWNLNVTTLAKFSYALGATGNRTNLNEALGTTNRIYSWQYDNLYRLTNETVSTSLSSSNLFYQYDGVGNRTNRSGSLGTLGSQTLAYNTNDWLTSDAYDNNGNTINSAGTNYQYDVMNHVTNVLVGGSHILMTYDGDGNRVSKKVGSTTTYYLVDGVNPSSYAQAMEEWTNNGATGLSKVYNYGLDLISQRQPNTSTNYFIYDGHGSTRMLVDTGSVTVNVMVYDAYGNLIASSGIPQTEYLYSGQQFDSDLELYYNRARYLNTASGRFWTMDTYEGNNEDPLSLHKYLYAEDDPVDGIDPLGLYTTDEGDAIHDLISMDYLFEEATNFADVTFGKPAGIGKNPRLQPDILNKDAKTYAEIKPLTSDQIEKGYNQLRTYDQSLRYLGYKRDLWPLGFPPFRIVFYNWAPYFYFNVDGLILYTKVDPAFFAIPITKSMSKAALEELAEQSAARLATQGATTLTEAVGTRVALVGVAEEAGVGASFGAATANTVMSGGAAP